MDPPMSNAGRAGRAGRVERAEAGEGLGETGRDVVGCAINWERAVGGNSKFPEFS